MAKRYEQRSARRIGRWAGAAALALVLSGCAAQASGLAGESGFILSSDVKMELQARKLPLIQGEQTPLAEEVRFADLLNVREGSVLYNREDGVYRTSLASLDRAEKLIDTPAAEVSANGHRALHDRDRRPYVSDLQSGETFELDGADENSQWSFADAEGEYVIGGVPGKVGLIHVTTGQAKWLNVKEQFDTEKKSHSYGTPYYFDGNIYVAGSFGDERNAIYKYSPDENKVRLYLDFPGGKAYDSIGQYRFLSDGKLLFDGTYDGQNGLFVYEPQTKAVSTLVLGTTVGNQDVGISFSLAPDGKKLLFHTRDESYDNLYQAELDGTQLTNIRYIMRDTLYASVSRLAYWNEDSASYALKYVPAGGTVESIVSYQF
ncbi:TolB family protein [Cohnella cellulosilytica]|uniref:TolB family protein n=1 Tax=Cohnella cellulosilytica TaxID=986710 RepID=A0ABW2F5D8_9BACL